MKNKSAIVEQICRALFENEEDRAKLLAQNEYPFQPETPQKRRFTELQATQVFLRDGFIDRYSGYQLVFPGILRLLARKLPEQFPYHRNWKMDSCHIVFWELFPTIDHVIPVARGGSDDFPNWVTTSMLHNAAKSNWLLEDLGWMLKPSGNLTDWDGLISLFLQFVTAEPALLSDGYLNRWHRAAIAAPEFNRFSRSFLSK